MRLWRDFALFYSETVLNREQSGSPAVPTLLLRRITLLGLHIYHSRPRFVSDSLSTSCDSVCILDGRRSVTCTLVLRLVNTTRRVLSVSTLSVYHAH